MLLESTIDTIPDEQIEEIAEFLFGNLDDINSAVKEAVGAGNELVKVSQVVYTMVFLHSIQRESLYTLRNTVQYDEAFVDAIDLVLADIDRNPGLFVYKYYGSKAVIRLICELVQLVPQAKGVIEIVEKINLITNIATSYIRDEILKMATYSEMVRSVTMYGYVSTLRTAVYNQRRVFVEKLIRREPIKEKEIAEYEFIYSSYVAAIKTALEFAVPIATGKIEEGNIQHAMQLCDKLTFDKYLMICLRELRQDMDAGVVAPAAGNVGFPNACIKTTKEASGSIIITKDNANIMDRPCSTKTDILAVLLESGALDAEYPVTGICENIAGNTWYKITTKSGQTGYIYSGNCVYTPDSDVTVTGLSVPTTLNQGDRFWLKGTISVQNATLLSVSFHVYDMNGLWKTGGAADVNGKSYVLDGSIIDNNTEFNYLEPGTYKCILSAFVEYNDTCIKEELHVSELIVKGITTSPDIPVAQGADFVKRSDGIWLWPLPEGNTQLNDWAGCQGNTVCPFHGTSIWCAIASHGNAYDIHGNGDYVIPGHTGIDIAAVQGTDVYASADGVLYCTGMDIPSRGIIAIVEHTIGNGYSYYSLYEHLSYAYTHMHKQPVKAGDVIAKSGNTDGGMNQTGAHLHFSIYLGKSGFGEYFAANPNGADSLFGLECRSWVLTEGLTEGKILTNPARNSPIESFTYYPDGGATQSSFEKHHGSIMYTFDLSQVVIPFVGTEPKPCAHEFGEWEIVVASGCTTEGEEHHPCILCDYFEIRTIPAKGHTGGEATCDSAAICSVCGTAYGEKDPNNHSGDTELRNRVEATEFEDGYSGDIYCADCDKLLEKGTVIPATHTHSFAAEWTFDAKNHWHGCACGEKSDLAAHVPGAEPTETTPQVCIVCGWEMKPAIVHTHKPEKVEFMDATHEADGFEEHYACACGVLFADAEGTEVITEDDIRIARYELGDVDHDHRLTSMDAMLLMQYKAGLLPVDFAFCTECADVDGKMGINSMDAMLILQFRAGLIESFR